MKIAINTTSAVTGGGVTYIKNLLAHLSEATSPHQYLVLTTISGKQMFNIPHPNFKFLSFKIPLRSPLLRLCWEQIVLPVFLKREGVDMLFSPANICPLFTKITNVIMIQNVEPFGNSVSIERGVSQILRLKLLKLLTILSIKKAKKVVFPSTKARNDVEKSGILLKHAEVIYHGINKELFRSCVENSVAHQIKKKYGLDKFIFYASNIQRYKGFLELAKAFVSLRDKIDNKVQLVFAGMCLDKRYYDEVKAFVAREGYENRVIFLGNIPYEELPYLYSTCMMFIYPSTCESFGMPLIEAMACGAPILASNVEPMTEICADAAVYFDPKNPHEMADAMLKVMTDQALIATLKMNSLKRATMFSWETAISKTLHIFETEFRNYRLK
ncbi:MAG: glycosyltransferase family 4 protein [Planctomycetota bacterium]|nr:glycosyltransferase family 4 protein [Planctomycetota bacterium]